NNAHASVLAKTLDEATGKLLENNKSPSRKVGELDNRGSQFYLALYWAQALAEQDEAPELKDRFAMFAKTLGEQQETIVKELLECQGQSVDIGGYYHPDPVKMETVMRPSATFNAALADLMS
ncbi:MAG: NADP-dependent isocitrate dehydrogenase, partial [Panacagrimonas sp.]